MRHHHIAAFLWLSLSGTLTASIPSFIVFSSDPLAKINFTGSGTAASMQFSGTSSVVSALLLPPYTPLASAKVEISGTSSLLNLVVDAPKQSANVSSPQTFRLTTSSGSFLTALLDWNTITSIGIGKVGSDILNASGIYNLTGFSTSLNGADAAQDAALAALANSAPGRLTLNTTSHHALTTLFANNSNKSIGGFVMSLDTAPEPTFVALVAVFGAGLFFWHRRRLAA